MDKPIYSGFVVLELGKLHMNETYYDILQPYFGQENIQLHYIDTDAFALCVNAKDISKDLKNLEDIFDFSNLDDQHELISNKNKKEWVFSKSRLLKIFGLMNSFVQEVKCIRLNVEKIVKVY